MAKLKLFKKKETATAENKENLIIPTHIAIIPDGNRRWAKARKLPVSVGHKTGADMFKKIIRYSNEIGVKYITFYAFSTENWKRDESEVKTLMNMLLNFLNNSNEELGKDKNKIRIKVIGDRSQLSEELNAGIDKVENDTKDNTDITVNIAINYGGRNEIKDCFKKIAEDVKAGKIAPEDITEEIIDNNLYTAGTPDPDLLIRTSGELRISNYLLWQLAYTEFYFADVNWPDFDSGELDKAILAYNKRQRRFGGS